MESIVKYVVSQFSLIEQAPVPFFICIAVISISVWKVISWHYSGRIESFEARNKLLTDQISDYRSKLSGASPDEARARLDVLETTVRSLSPRSLSQRHAEILTSQLSRDPGRAYILLSVTSHNAKLLHADLERCFREARYDVTTWIAGQTRITHDSLSLRVPNIEQLTSRQVLVLTALRSLNLEVVVEHEPDHPANEHPIDIWLVVR